ncbi:MAG: DUF4115 domain-containing protein [Coriobacteriia bacterium]|nr:DUF4115 domain-containing protein [Coriobacteriia bacterium]
MSESLGRILEKQRHSLGRSLAEAEADTKIRRRLLSALEQGEYEALPSPAYVKGYIISYARFLRLDPAPLVELYEEEIGQTGPITAPRLPDEVITPRHQGQQLPWRTALAIIAVVLVIGTIIWGISQAVRKPESPPPIPTAGETTSAPEPSVEPTAPGETETSSTPEGDATQPAKPFTLRVVIASDSASWLRVTVDGLTAYEGTMAGGQEREWQVAEEASVRIGKPTAVTVYRDDLEVEIPGGDPPTVVLSATD